MAVEYYEDKSGEWRWRLKGANGEIVAQGEGHNSKADAQRAYEAMRQVAIETVDDLIEKGE